MKGQLLGLKSNLCLTALVFGANSNLNLIAVYFIWESGFRPFEQLSLNYLSEPKHMLTVQGKSLFGS
jgi:hypothetical protein